ncbi:hypothetical protein [uncultured Mucilaginibacter sp.]|uniref:hypothetical protein n=1 Tax=uncultured Mucilaginibacter sp. TaxID=797541 RepID=UPI00263123B9|nr:hypothetical protein [uncultured Mucilaginibacter sp.]
MLVLTFFFVDEKEPKNQDKPDPSGRFVRPFRTWAKTCCFGMQGGRKIADKRSIEQTQVAARKGNLQGSHPGAWGRMPPGGDPAFLIFWFFLIKQKERTRKKLFKKGPSSPG